MKRNFAKISILLCLLSVLGLAGCSKRTAPAAIAWNNLIYGPTGTEVSQSEIGKQLGEIKRIKKPMPTENGDSNYAPLGSKIFEIAGVDTDNELAIEVDGKYYKYKEDVSIDYTK